MRRLDPNAVSGDRYANVKQLRLRLASVKSIQRITKVSLLPPMPVCHRML